VPDCDMGIVSELSENEDEAGILDGEGERAVLVESDGSTVDGMSVREP
jgi:hypothetical protein